MFEVPILVNACTQVSYSFLVTLLLACCLMNHLLVFQIQSKLFRISLRVNLLVPFENLFLRLIEVDFEFPLQLQFYSLALSLLNRLLNFLWQQIKIHILFLTFSWLHLLLFRFLVLAFLFIHTLFFLVSCLFISLLGRLFISFNCSVLLLFFGCHTWLWFSSNRCRCHCRVLAKI